MANSMYEEELEMIEKLKAKVTIKVATFRFMRDNHKPIKKDFNRKLIYSYVNVIEDLERQAEELKELEEKED